MALVEEDILAEGAQIIWVLQADARSSPGTAESCRQFMLSRGSDKGICVGDGQTQPTAGVFDNSPFAERRGYDVLMRRSEMKVLWVSTHGTTAGNENLSGQEVLEIIRSF
ncbi:MAG: hypothetical protein AAFN74_10745 [Myxococcota bacterium]